MSHLTSKAWSYFTEQAFRLPARSKGKCGPMWHCVEGWSYYRPGKPEVWTDHPETRDQIPIVEFKTVNN